MMKTNKLFVLAAFACGAAMTFTSCSKSDNAIIPQGREVTVSFENQLLNDQGFWIGDAEGDCYSYTDDWGGKTTTYTGNAYVESVLTAPVTYNLYESAYGTSDFWSGFAISNRTATDFDMATLTPDQYNSAAGGAHTGRNFCVVTSYGETITINGGKGAVVESLYFTNSAYAVNSIVNGDYYAGAPFEANDWFTCIITGTKADGSEVSVEVPLAKDGSYVSQWQKLNLTSMGKVKSLAFAFTGSRSNDYGVLTPAYICIDDVKLLVEN